MIFVAAAGNSGGTSRLYPAYHPDAVAVPSPTTATRGLPSRLRSGVGGPGGPGGERLLDHPKPPLRERDHTPGASGITGRARRRPRRWPWPCLPYGTSNSSVRNCLQVAAGGIPGTGTYWSAGRIKAARAVAA